MRESETDDVAAIPVTMGGGSLLPDYKINFKIKSNKNDFFNASSFSVFTAIFLFLAVVSPVFAQRGRNVSVGLGAEVNMNSGSDFGAGAVAAIDVGFADYWAVGLTVKGSHDFASAWVAEGGVLLRRYFPGRSPWQGETHSGFFLQADAGVHVILEDNVFMYAGDVLPRFMGGLRAGYRFLLGRSRAFYVEPFGRGGYPFAWGAGLMLGIRF